MQRHLQRHLCRDDDESVKSPADVEELTRDTEQARRSVPCSCLRGVCISKVGGGQISVARTCSIAIFHGSARGSAGSPARRSIKTPSSNGFRPEHVDHLRFSASFRLREKTDRLGTPAEPSAWLSRRRRGTKETHDNADRGSTRHRPSARNRRPTTAMSRGVRQADYRLSGYTQGTPSCGGSRREFAPPGDYHCIDQFRLAFCRSVCETRRRWRYSA